VIHQYKNEQIFLRTDLDSVPQNAIEIERCLRITSVITALRHLVGMIVVAPLFLPRVGIAPADARNESSVAPFGALFDSGKKQRRAYANRYTPCAATKHALCFYFTFFASVALPP
jgi:hypothetical protein